MEKLRKYAILPLTLFFMEYCLGFYLNPWRYGYLFPTRFWQGVRLIFLNLAACAAFVLLITLLFLLAFTPNRLIIMLTESVLKSMAASLTAYLAIELLWNNFLLPFLKQLMVPLSTVDSNSQIAGGMIVGLSLLPHLLLVTLTVYFVIKSLHINFSLDKAAFWIMILIFVAVITLDSFYTFWLQKTINTVNTNANGMVEITVSGITMSVDLYNRISVFCASLIAALIDCVIFCFFSRCIYWNREQYKSDRLPG